MLYAWRIRVAASLMMLAYGWDSIYYLWMRWALNFRFHPHLIWECFALSARNLVSISIILMWLLFIFFARNHKIRKVWRRHHHLCFLLIFHIISPLIFILFILIDNLTHMTQNVIHILLLRIGNLRVLSQMLIHLVLIYPWGHLFIDLPVLCMRLCVQHSQITNCGMNLQRFAICDLLLIRQFIS